MKRAFLIFMLFFAVPLMGTEAFYLRDNLKLAQKGDYLVTAQGKMATVLHIFERTPQGLLIEEVSIPSAQLPCTFTNWKQWMEQGAPGNTAWVVYGLDLATGHMLQCYSMTKRAWINIPEATNFLTTLLNLQFTRIPDWQKKKAGPPPLPGIPDRRQAWQPRMILESQEIKGVLFDAFRARWPSDKTILSDKTIDVYLPQETGRYPAYFPYWLQISGVVGKAQVYIIDSGHEMKSPALLPKASS